GRLRGDERAGEVDVEDPLPVAQLQLQERLARAIAGVVYQQVDAAKPVGELVDDPRALVHRVEVQVGALAPPADRLDLLYGRRRPLFVAMPGDAKVITSLIECQGRGTPDPAVAARDDRDR